MGALRKAGVWLGLIEDEEDRRYADDRHFDDRRYDGGGFDADFGDEFDDEELAPAPRSRLDRDRPVRERLDGDRSDRASVRSLTRPTTGPSLTQDNLALAPQVQLRERALVSDEDQRSYTSPRCIPRRTTRPVPSGSISAKVPP